MSTYNGTSISGTAGVSSTSSVSEDAAQFTQNTAGYNAITASNTVAASTSGAIYATSASTTNGVACVSGTAQGASGSVIGVYGGASSSGSGIGVKGESLATSGTSYGVYATCASASGYAVYGTNSAGGTAVYGTSTSSGSGVGVYASSAGGNGIECTTTSSSQSAIYAHTTAGGPGAYVTSSTTTSSWGAVVASNSSSGNGLYASSSTGSATYATSAITSATSGTMYATNTSTGNAIYATSSGTAISATTSGAGTSDYYAIYATTSGTAGTAIYAEADMNAGSAIHGNAGSTSNGDAILGTASGTGSHAGNFQGAIAKSSGTFLIDHPVEPEKKFLQHSFVESPDMKNVYDGVVQADKSGEAIIDMPSYFESLNDTFRYQLTPIGGPAPNLHIKEELRGGRFCIAGAGAGQKISWQITGIRRDPWALAHPVIVELEKSDAEKGFYRHPEVYGLPESKGLYGRRPRQALHSAGVKSTPVRSHSATADAEE